MERPVMAYQKVNNEVAEMHRVEPRITQQSMRGHLELT